MRARIRFLVWYAASRLAAPDSFRITTMSVATVAAVVGFTIVAFGLLLGSRREAVDRLRRDPLALRLVVGDALSGRPVTPQLVAEVDRNITRALGGRGDGYLGCYAYRELDLPWSREGAVGNAVVYLAGRTIAPGDPLLSSYSWQPRITPETIRAGEGGAFVTRDMLGSLGLGQADVPRSLRLEMPSSLLTDVRVLAVTEGRLPQGDSYVIPEAYYETLRTATFDRAVPALRTGPVPPGWPEPRMLPGSVRDLLEGLRLRVAFATTDRREGWVMEYLDVDQVPRVSEWTSALRRIGEAMVAQGYASAPGFAVPKTPDGSPAPDLGPYDKLGVYASDTEALVTAANVCRTMGLPFSEDLVRQLDAVARRTAVAAGVLGGALVALVAVAGWSLSVVHALWAERRAAEFGILKAIGMDHLSLAALGLLESAIIWVIGYFTGLVFGVVCGSRVARLLYEADPGGVSTDFDCPLSLAVAAAVGSAALCLAGAGMAGRRVRQAPPCETLHAT